MIDQDLFNVLRYSGAIHLLNLLEGTVCSSSMLSDRSRLDRVYVSRILRSFKVHGLIQRIEYYTLPDQLKRQGMKFWTASPRWKAIKEVILETECTTFDYGYINYNDVELRQNRA